MTFELDQLLSDWAAAHRLNERQSALVRANVLATTSTDAAFDADWLWSLLRPVTALLERGSGSDDRLTAYLQLA